MANNGTKGKVDSEKNTRKEWTPEQMKWTPNNWESGKNGSDKWMKSEMMISSMWYLGVQKPHAINSSSISTWDYDLSVICTYIWCYMGKKEFFYRRELVKWNFFFTYASKFWCSRHFKNIKNYPKESAHREHQWSV